MFLTFLNKYDNVVFDDELFDILSFVIKIVVLRMYSNVASISLQIQKTNIYAERTYSTANKMQNKFVRLTHGFLKSNH